MRGGEGPLAVAVKARRRVGRDQVGQVPPRFGVSPAKAFTAPSKPIAAIIDASPVPIFMLRTNSG